MCKSRKRGDFFNGHRLVDDLLADLCLIESFIDLTAYWSFNIQSGG
jgi:hypothetical protein